MTLKSSGAPKLRAPNLADLRASLRAGIQDFASAPLTDGLFASAFVLIGMLMGWITWATGQSFWLVLAALGFPLVGALAAVGFYEVSRRLSHSEPTDFKSVLSVVWAQRLGQLPWLAVIIVVVFLAWFFLGHMIFALFLGLSPMTNVSTSLDVFFTSQGMTMLAFGSLVGAVFALLVFAICVMGMPMILDRDVDFVTAMLSSIACFAAAPVPYLVWGGFIGLVTLAAMLPYFLGLFVAMPILGHATWHLYCRLQP